MAALAARRPVTIVGLGCIGGSLARALAAQGVEVRGWSTDASDRAHASAAGIAVPSADGDPLARVCSDATVVVLAVPLEQIGPVARATVAAAPASARLLHVGGLQQRERLGLDEADHARLIGTHPLAGSHEAGFGASRPDLFVGCTVSVEDRADDRTRLTAEWLWRTVGASRLDYRSAESHDRLMAWVSHLPQLAATAVAHTLATAGVDPQQIGTGARDVTRLAATPLGAWPALLRGAPAELRRALATLEQTVADLRQALDANDVERLATLWDGAANWRRRAANGAR